MLKAPPYYQEEISGRISSYKSDMISLRRAVEQHVSFGLTEEQSFQGTNDPFEVIRIMAIVIGYSNVLYL